MKKEQSNKESGARKILSQMIWVLSVALYFIGEGFIWLKKQVLQNSGGKTGKKSKRQTHGAAAREKRNHAAAAATAAKVAETKSKPVAAPAPEKKAGKQPQPVVAAAAAAKVAETKSKPVAVPAPEKKAEKQPQPAVAAAAAAKVAETKSKPAAAPAPEKKAEVEAQPVVAAAAAAKVAETKSEPVATPAPEKKAEVEAQPVVATAAAKVAATQFEPVAAEKPEKMPRRKILRIVVICLLAALLCVLLVIGGKRLHASMRADRIYKELSSDVQQVKNPDANNAPVTTVPSQDNEPADGNPTEPVAGEPTEPVAETVPQETEPQMLPHYAQLYEKNSDLFGWVKIDDTKIDYPVMYVPDNLEKYLYRDFEGNSYSGGTPYMDVRCNADSENYLIYGHNMKNGTMFKHLLKYQDKKFWEDHQTVYFDTLYEEGEYEVVAAFYDRVYYNYEDVFKFYNVIELDDEASYNEAVANLKEKSIYDTGITPQYGAQLVTLITCAYHTDNGKFVVVLAEKAAG